MISPIDSTGALYLFLRSIKYAPNSPIMADVIENHVICTGLVIHLSAPVHSTPDQSIIYGDKIASIENEVNQRTSIY
jgi:hypothetical protein